MKKIFLIFVFLFIISPVYSISVCSSGCDYTSISEAVAGANSGDTITISSGTYVEPPLVINNSINIKASGNVVIKPEKKDLFIILGAKNVSISGVILRDGRTCFDILYSSNVALSGIDIENCSTPYHISDSSNVKITGASVYNSDSGIEAMNTTYLSIINADFSSITLSPIFYNSTSHSTLKGIKISGSSDGIYLLNSQNISISSSEVTVTDDGIIIDTSTTIIISDSKITSRFPIKIVNSNSNTIKNSIIKAGAYAIYLDASGGNTIYANDIYGSVIIQNSQPNIWNTTEGNYWSVYTGEDANGDGIIDAPYRLDANNIDYLPRAEPYVKESPTTPAPQPAPAGGGGGASPKQDPVGAYSQLTPQLLSQIYDYFNIKGKHLYTLDPAFSAAFLAMDTDIYPATGDKTTDSKIGRNYGKLSRAQEYALLSRKIKSSLLNTEHIVIAREDIPADAISAIAYARARKIPLILVKTQEIPSEIENLIKTLNPRKIIIIGGPVAISPEVEKKLKKYAPVLRVYGDTRVETSLRVAEMTSAVTKLKVVVIQDGWNIDPRVSIVASLYRAPVIYTRHNKLTPEAVEFLKKHTGVRVIFAGVTPAIIDEVKKILGE